MNTGIFIYLILKHIVLEPKSCTLSVVAMHIITRSNHFMKPPIVGVHIMRTKKKRSENLHKQTFALLNYHSAGWYHNSILSSAVSANHRGIDALLIFWWEMNCKYVASA